MSAGAERALIRLEGVHFRYPGAGFALDVPALDIAAGERVACVGPSGSGKTTLIQLISGVLAPQRGRVRFAEHELGALSDRRRRALRLREIGMVFQEFELLDYLSALDNILLPQHLAGGASRAARERARALAAELGIEPLLARGPEQLSQGERQRVALCRALVTGPRLLLCDEATGNLDPEATESSLQVLFEAVEREGATLVMVTHDHGLLPAFERVLDMRELAGGAA